MNFESMPSTGMTPAEEQLFAIYKKNNPDGTVEQFLSGRAAALDKASTNPREFEQVAGVLMEEIPSSNEELLELTETERSIGGSH